MLDRIKTNILYQIRDMRSEYSAINIFVSSLDFNDKTINNIRTYADLITMQIGLLDTHYDDPIKFSKDIRFIKLYSQKILRIITDSDNDLLTRMYINLLNGIIYCDEIEYTYVNHVSDEVLSKLNTYDDEDIVKVRI